MKKIGWTVFLFILFNAGDAFAIQEHQGVEGFYVHQIGHLFFIAAMVYIYIVLKKPAASMLEGWKYIRYAAIFFILWNIDAFISHLLDGLSKEVEVSKSSTAVTISSFKTAVYYLTRLTEYFLLVPAFVMMAFGTYKIRKQLEKESTV